MGKRGRRELGKDVRDGGNGTDSERGGKELRLRLRRESKRDE